MELVEKVVKLPKASADLASALSKIALAAKKSQEDGWQAGQDLPAILSASVVALMPVIAEVLSLPEEAKLSPIGMAEAFAVEGLELAKVLVEKPVAVAVDPTPVA